MKRRQAVEKRRPDCTKPNPKNHLELDLEHELHLGPDCYFRFFCQTKNSRKQDKLRALYQRLQIYTDLVSDIFGSTAEQSRCPRSPRPPLRIRGFGPTCWATNAIHSRSGQPPDRAHVCILLVPRSRPLLWSDLSNDSVVVPTGLQNKGRHFALLVAQTQLLQLPASTLSGLYGGYEVRSGSLSLRGLEA